MIVLLILLTLVIGFIIGAIFVGVALDAYQQTQRSEREARLNTLWRTLHTANRINVARWVAYEAMRREAAQHQPNDQ